MFHSHHNNLADFEFSSIQDSENLEKSLSWICFYSSVALALSAVSPWASVCFSTRPTSRLSETDGGGLQTIRSSGKGGGRWWGGENMTAVLSQINGGLWSASCCWLTLESQWEGQGGAMRWRDGGEDGGSVNGAIPDGCCEDSKGTNICPGKQSDSWRWEVRTSLPIGNDLLHTELNQWILYRLNVTCCYRKRRKRRETNRSTINYKQRKGSPILVWCIGNAGMQESQNNYI